MLSACPPLIYFLGNILICAEGRLRPCKWMRGALPSWLISFISINFYVSWHPYQLGPAIDGSPRQIQNYLETLKGLEGYPTFEKNVDVPTCVTLFIFYIMQALITHISAWNTVVLSPKLKLCSLLKPHLYTPAPVPLLVCVPDEALFDIQFNSILLQHLSGYLTMSGLWYVYLGIIQFSPHL